MTGFPLSRCCIRALSAGLGFLFIFNLTTAQTNYYWDPNGAAAGLGGGGTWTDGGLTWRQGATNSETLVAFHYDQTGYANFSGSGTVVVNASTLVGAVLADWNTGIDFVLNSNLNIWGTGQNSIIAGDISGSGGIDFRNTTGYLQLLGTNTFGGSLVSVGRPIYIGDGGTTGSITSNAPLYSGAQLIFDRSNDLTYVGTISGDGTGILRKRGEGTLTLTGSLPALDSIQVEEGTLEYGNGGSFYNGTAMDINVGSGATMAYNSDGASASFVTSNITGHGTVEKRGTNQLNLSGSITTTAGVHIAEGTLNIFGTGSLHDNRQLSLADTAGATLRLEKNETIGSLTGGGANGGDVNLAFGDLTLATMTGSTSQSFGGDFSGSGALILNSYWNNIFSGDIAHTGGTTINNGTLTVGAGGTRGTLSGNVTNNGTLGFSRSDASTYTGNISGTGSLHKDGAGTLTLSGDHSFTGGTNIVSSGMLLFADKGAFYGGNINSTNAQKLSVGSGAAAGFGVGSGAYFAAADIDTVLSHGDFADGAAVGFDTSNADGNLFSYSSIISDTDSGANALGIIKSGTGTLLLSGSNTNTGPITVQGGTLRVAGGSALPDQAKVTLSDVAGVTLDLNSTNETIGSLAGGGTNGGNVTLGSGTLTTGGDNTSTSFAGIISGSGSVVKQGTGTFALTGANTFVGGTTVSAGTLQLDHANGLADSGAVTVNAGATLDLNNTNETIGSLAGGGTVAMGSGNLTTGGNNTATVFSGEISGNGTLIKDGSNTFSLTGTNSFSGGVSILDGTLIVGDGATSGGGFTGGIAISSGANLTMDRSDETTYSSVISGDGSFSYTGTGSLRLNGNNTYTGGTTLASGTLELGHANAISTSGPISFTGGTLLYNAAAGDLSSRFSSADNQEFRIDVASQSVTYASDLSSSGGILVKSGTGTLTLSGANTFDGATTVNRGTLTLTGGNALSDSSAVSLANTSGVTLALGGNETIGSLAGGGSTGGNVSLGDHFLTVGGDNTDTEFFGAMTGTNGGLTKIGSGTFTLSSSNTNWNGDTTINGGTLKATAFSVPWGSDLILADTAGVTFEIAYAGVERLAGLSGGGSNGGTVSIASGGTLQPGFNDATSQFDGVITGAGALDKIGTGTLTLAGANTFTGDTTITAGTLTLAHADALQNSTLTTATGLDFGTLTSATLGGLSGSDNLALLNSDSTPAAVAITVGGNDADTSYSGVLSEAGSLTKTGTGNLTLSSTNTFTGGTTINAGTLTLGHATDTLADAGTVNIAGGTLALGANSDTVGTVNLSSGSITGSGTLTGSAYNLTDTGSISAILGGSAALTKSGDGTVTLSGSNTYTGSTTINAGTLAVSGGSAIADDNAVSIASGAVFDLNDTTETVGSISGAGSIDLGSGTLTAGGNNTSTAFSGVISGADGSLIKQGTGTLTLSGNNTFTGGTTISAGTLAADNDALPGATTLDGGTLSTAAFDAANLTPTSGTLVASGSLTNVPTISANFTVDLTPGGSFGDSTTLDGGTAKVGSFNLATGNLTFTSGTLDTSGTLTIGSDDSSTSLSGSIAGSGSLTKTGTGNLTLSGANTYSGGTTINAGTLTLGHATDTLANAGTVTIAGGTLALGSNSDTVGTVNLSSGSITGSGTLTGSAFNLTDTGNISAKLGGSAALTKSGSGTTTLSGDNSYSGGTTINAGTLGLGSATALGTGSVTMAGGNLDNTSGSALTLTTNNTHNWSNAFTFVGSNDLTLGAGTVNITTDREIRVDAGTLTIGATSWTNGGSYNFLKSGAGTLKLSGAASSFSFVNHTVSAGTLELASGYSNDASGIFAGYDFVSGPTANNATLLISGGQATPFGTYIGGGAAQNVSAANESGVLNLTSGSLQTRIVAVRNGEFNMTGGSGHGQLYIGTLNGQSGAATISGGTWISRTDGLGTGEDGSAIVGSGTGTGTLTLGDGGILQADSISLGNAASSLNFGAGGTSGTTTATVFNGFAGGTINFNHTGTLSISARIDSSGDINHLSSGTTTLSGDIAYHYTSPGAVNISDGTLKVTSGDALQDRAVVTLSNVSGATLTLDGANETIGALAGGGSTGGDVSLGSNTLTLGLPSDGSNDFAGDISGTGSIIKAGTNTQIFSGTNTYTGGTTISAGTLQIGNGGTSGSIDGDITNNASLTINRSDGLTISGIISGSGSLNLAGSGHITLTNDNTFGDTTISAGSLTLGNGGTTGSVAGNIINNGSVIFNRSDDQTFSSIISGTGSLNKTGTNTLTLSDADYSGDTEVDQGTLNTTSHGLAANSTYEVFNGATLEISTANAQIAGLKGSGTVNLNNNLLNIGKSGINTIFDGTLTGSGHVVVSNGGFLVLSGAQTLTGTIGTFDANSVLVLDDDVSFAASNNFDIGENTFFSVERSNDLTLAGNFALKDSATLNKLGTGTLTLSGSNSRTEAGIIDIDAGTLRTSGSSGGMFQNASVTIESGATLDLADTNQSFASFNALPGSAITLGSGQLTTTANADSTIEGTLSGTGGSLVKQGTGTLTLADNNTFTGGTTVSAGTLQIGSGGTTGSLAGDITNNGNVTFNRSDNQTFAGNISGTGTLTKQADNVLTLSGTNTYAGDTFVNDGTLRMGSANALSPNTTLRVAPGATFNPNGFAQTVANLGGTGDIDVGTGGLNVNPTGTNTFTGRLIGNGGLTKGGTGTLELTGTHTFSGPTAINAGRIRLTGSAANSAFAINNGGTLSGTGTLGSLTVNTGGILAPGNSPGTLSAGNTVWAGDASFILELDHATEGAGSGWDLLNITGTLTINATMANPFTVNVDTLLNGTNTAGAMSNFDADSSYSWTFAQTSGGISYGTNASVGASFAINTDDFANATNGTFSIAQIGNNLALTYSAVPEPGSFGLILGTLALGFGFTRRRRVRQSY